MAEKPGYPWFVPKFDFNYRLSVLINCYYSLPLFSEFQEIAHYFTLSTHKLVIECY